MRYIDAENLPRHGNRGGVVYWRDIEAQPTVDVVEVVRCKDCVYGEIDDKDFPTQYLCNRHGCDWNDENHFCGYGDRGQKNETIH